MGRAFKIGRVVDIDVLIDWSWLLVFTLMTWNLSTLFVQWHPNWNHSAAFFLAIVASLLFFASIFVHELAHALVAKSFGMKVRSIRLFLFGGVSDIEREPPSARAELRMAIVGPLTSLAIGLVLSAIATMTMPAAGTPLQTLAFWLGPANMTIGLFNLIPAFPLDGGRVLRALVWRVTGNLHYATRIAATIGRHFGLALMLIGGAMLLGIRMPFFGSGSGGMWLAFLGWFLREAADRSFGALVMEEMFDGIRVEHLMRRSGPVLDPHVTLQAAVSDGLVHDHARPVMAEGHLLGILSVDDLRKVPAREWASTPVTHSMTPFGDLVTVEADLPAVDAMKRLAEHHVEQLPVFDGDRFVGILTRADITRWLEQHVDQPLVPRPV